MTTYLGNSVRLDLPETCAMCSDFMARLDKVAMPREAFVQRGKLVVIFQAAHHSLIIMDDLRAWTMIKTLERGGWPRPVLRIVAELLVDVEL